MNAPVYSCTSQQSHDISSPFPDKNATECKVEEGKGKVNRLSLKIMSYNVCHSDKVARDPYLCWESRKDRIFKLILDEFPDIICFQEMRNTKEGCVMADLWINLGNNGYDIISLRNNPSAGSFINVIAYKMSVLSLDKVYRWWASEKSPYQLSDDWGKGWGRLTLMAKFYPLIDKEIDKTEVKWPDFDKEPLYVVNLHNGLDVKERCKANENTVNRIKQQVKKTGHVFVCGDYNNFPEDEGEKELNFFKDANYEEISSPLTTKEGIPVAGTFIGFSNDSYQIKNPGTFGAQLDHIFYKHFPTTVVNKSMFKCYVNAKKYFDNPANRAPSEEKLLPNSKDKKVLVERDFLYTHTGESLRDKFPSDHLPLIVEVDLSLLVGFTPTLSE